MRLTPWEAAADGFIAKRRDRHDGAQQRLVGIALQLRRLHRRVSDDPSAEQLSRRRARRSTAA